MIELKNLYKTYLRDGEEFYALKNINLHIARGEIYGVVGESGAGKSTLIRCVNLLERPTKGEVWLAGQKLNDLKNKALHQARHNIGMIFQHFNLLAQRNVKENIMLPLELIGTNKKERHKRAEELLELIGLKERAKHYPAQLSGGQKQRVAIARALASAPQVLLSDEATSALDPKTTDSILSLLKTINQELGVTILLITHEMEVVKKICNRVALIENGEIIENNSVEQFFSAPESALGKQFIKQSQSLKLPEIYEKRLKPQGKNPIICLHFKGKDSERPLLSHLSREYNVDINIIQAQIEHIGESNFGTLIAEILGTETAIKNTLNHLNTLPLDMETLGYVD